MNIDLMYTEYLNGELYNKFIEAKKEAIDNDYYLCLDMLSNLYNNNLFIEAEKLNGLNMFDLDYYFNDIFVIMNEYVNMNEYDNIDKLVQKAYNKVKSKTYFNSILNNLDNDTLKILASIYR